jgi:NADH-quinone oxidoreductase subunit E
MMVEARKENDDRTVAKDAAEVSRFAEASARLFAEQAAAMTAMTVYGIRAASEMTSMMLGALRGPVPSDGATAQEPIVDEPVANVVPLRTPAAAAPSAKAQPRPAKKATEPAAAKAPRSKAASPKQVVAKAKAEAPKPAPTKRDDLKKISGIGPRLETVLNERGITRFADLAGLSKAALKKLDSDLGLEGRVIRDDWAVQASALSGGKG